MSTQVVVSSLAGVYTFKCCVCKYVCADVGVGVSVYVCGFVCVYVQVYGEWVCVCVFVCVCGYSCGYRRCMMQGICVYVACFTTVCMAIAVYT